MILFGRQTFSGMSLLLALLNSSMKLFHEERDIVKMWIKGGSKTSLKNAPF
jgi:hypothetical protein